MKTTWIVVADEHRVRIFEVEGAQGDFHEIEDFVSPEGRMREQALMRDAKGHYLGKGKGERVIGHTAEPNVSKSRHDQELFAKQTGDFLDKAGAQHRYDKLRVIAFAKFLGLLRNHLSKQTQQLIEEEVSKDISGFGAKEIEEYIKTRMH